MAEKSIPPSPDRVRAGAALRNAVDVAKREKRIAGQEELAEALQIRQRSFISQVYKGARALHREHVLRAAERLGCSAWDIATDTIRAKLEEDSKRDTIAGKAEDGYVSIRRYAAGEIRGLYPDAMDQSTPLRLPSEWLTRDGIDAESVRVATVTDDGMAPEVRAGSDAIVRTDLAEEPYLASRVYLIERRGAIVARRIEAIAGGSLLLTCDNRKAGIASEIVHAAEIDARRSLVLGVVWWRFGRVA